MADETKRDLTREEMAARIEELEGRLARGGTIRFKVSEKGCVSVYGLGRFPVTLYVDHPQPFRQLAWVLRENGDDAGAIEVLVAQQDARFRDSGFEARGPMKDQDKPVT